MVLEDHLFSKADALKQLDSPEDKLRIINNIKNKSDYLTGNQEGMLLIKKSKNRYNGDTLRANYETKRQYKTEIWYPNGKEYTPTYKIVSVSKKRNTLTFEHILD